MLRHLTISRHSKHRPIFTSPAKALLIHKLSERFPADYLARVFDKMPSTKPLDFQAGPLVWIDLEMTGLNPQKDKILEIAVLITNGNLDVVDEGVQYIVRTEKSFLKGSVRVKPTSIATFPNMKFLAEDSRMDEWCTKQHGRSGLTKACLNSPHTTEFVAKSVLEYIKKWVPEPRIAVLAGNSVHVDKTFLAVEMPEIVNWLHYRIVDVSSIKELARRWYPESQAPRLGEISHRALDDIRGSIRELKWYRENLFITPAEGTQRNTLKLHV